MPKRVRKIMLVLHVATSVSWLGLTIGDIALGLTAITTDDPETQHAMFMALGVIGGVLLLPIAWLAYLTGLLGAVGTQWGLVRHKWVLTKFVLTTVTVLLTTFSFVPGVLAAADTARAAAPGELVSLDGGTSGLISAGIVSGSIYTLCVILSVIKPWGRTRWGRGKPEAKPNSTR